MRAMVDLGGKVNIMHLAYATKLGLRTRKIDVSVQKINGFHLNIFGMVIADCSVKDKLERVQSFQKTFLLANIDLEVVLTILFFTLSIVNISFVEQEFI